MIELKQSKPNTISSDLKIDQGYLKEMVEALSFERVYGTAANAKAAEIVRSELAFLGAEYFGETKSIRAGNGMSATLIGAHFDSVTFTPGADDNASAVAVMLAAAHILKDKVGYAAFNGEECGLLGSYELNEIVSPFYRPKTHILEMVGYRSFEPNSQKSPVPFMECPTTGDFLGIVGNDEALIDSIIETAGTVSIPVVGFAIPQAIPTEAIEQISPHLLRSDHAPFWKKQIPAVMWTDTSEFRNPHYHKATDTPDTLDYEFMAEITKLLVNTIERSLS